MENNIILIGTKIKSLRMESGISQEQLSKLSGVERAQISRIESGEVPGVSFLTIEKIFNSLGYAVKFEKEHNETFYTVHPFVKWAGGKTQLLDVIVSHMPEKYNRYFEPFVGGGALLFKIQPSSFSINDMNEDLMLVYQCFLDDDLYNELIRKLEFHEQSHSEEYYYQVRDLDRSEDYNQLSIVDKASRLIYLNKSCFNGLYRVNSKGYFNVPSGKKKSVSCFDRVNFDNLKMFFKYKKVVITSVDFEMAVRNAKAGDFVYFDPPYDTWDDKSSFTSYGKISFGKDEQARLAKVFKELSDKGVYVMLSNHNTAFIRELYSDYHITIVKAKRMINSKADGRGEVEEVLITNYE